MSVAAALLTTAATPADISRLVPNVKTTVANAMWSNDAFPGTPHVPPHGRLTLAYFNATHGGRVTQMHMVLTWPPRTLLQRHVALSITYNDAAAPSIFVPIGDFFMDQLASQSDFFENKYFAKRPTDSWYCTAPMPYERSIKIELVNGLNISVGGYTAIYHDDQPFERPDGYFHAYYAANSRLAFPWQPALLLPHTGVTGPGHLVGTSMVFVGDASKFPNNFDVVCEGNVENFIDNTTTRFGNDSSVDYRKLGYQTSEHVVAILGSEDWFGYSYGWAGNSTVLAGTQLHDGAALHSSLRTGTTVWEKAVNFSEVFLGPHGHARLGESAVLATYRLLEAPIRFAKSLHAQVNWGYDIGHNVPSDHCPKGRGCPISYETVSYFYLQTPRDASSDVAGFPWPLLGSGG